MSALIVHGTSDRVYLEDPQTTNPPRRAVDVDNDRVERETSSWLRGNSPSLHEVLRIYLGIKDGHLSTLYSLANLSGIVNGWSKGGILRNGQQGPVCVHLAHDPDLAGPGLVLSCHAANNGAAVKW